MVRTDSAVASGKILSHLRSLGVEFSTSYTLPFGEAHVIDWINYKQYWQLAVVQHGNERTDAFDINAADIVPLTHCPRTPNNSCGQTLALQRAANHARYRRRRIKAPPTNSPRWHRPFLNARHRARGRCENRIKTLKNTSRGKHPFCDFAAN